MMIFANPVSGFVERHPTIKMLALSFLLLIGVNLIAEGLGFHIPRGYTYFAMAFSLFVEMLNLKMRARKPAPRAVQSRRLQKAIHRIEAPH
jgi:predicted tellurium resistance membrane protein TerC